MKLLEDRVVVVTGAGRGIGRAEALLCAGLGARVVVNDCGCDRDGTGADASVAQSTVDAIVAAGGTAVADASDVTTEGAPDRLVELAVARFGRFDGLVHAAGIVREATLLKTPPDDLTRLFDVQVRAAFELTRAAAARLVDARTPGAIVLHTSPNGFFGVARQSALGACSAAVVGLVRSAAVELRRHAVRVNAIAPTARTRITEDMPLFKGIKGDSMTPEHIAPLAAFLLSDLASDVHGEVLGVAGQRHYALLARETTGVFLDGTLPTPEGIAAAFGDIIRG